MSIHLLDGSLQVNIFYENRDSAFEDNICILLREDCPDGERLFRAIETNIFITPSEACELAKALNTAAQCSIQNS
jgi:hypothetical protein